MFSQFLKLRILIVFCRLKLNVVYSKQQKTCHQTSSKFVDLGFVKISDELVCRKLSYNKVNYKDKERKRKKTQEPDMY